MNGLTIKQENFCLAYVETGNASEAYRRAYPVSRKWKDETLWPRASRLLADCKVDARIKELRAATVEAGVMSAADALLEASRLARFDIRKLYRGDGSPIPIHELDEETARCLAGVDIQEIYAGSGDERVFIGLTKKYKIHDKNSALEKLFKHHGLYERDNRQKTDPIAELIASLSGNVFGVVKDVDG